MWSSYILQLLVLIVFIGGSECATPSENGNFGRLDETVLLPEDILAEKMKHEIARKVRPDYAPNKDMLSPEARALSYDFATAKALHLKKERLTRRRHRRHQDHTVISNYFQDTNDKLDGGEHLTISSRSCPHCTEDENRIWFNFDELSTYTFDDATLLVDIGKIKTKYPGHEYKMQFYLYVSDDKVIEYRHSRKPHQFDNSTKPNEFAKKWEEMVITPLVRKWHKEPSTNFGAMVKISIYNENNFVETMPLWASHPVSYLELSNTKRRVKRDFRYEKRKRTPVCTMDTSTGDVKKQTNDTCCLYPFTVNFDHIKWDFIIAPKVVEMFYCTGYCNFGTLRKVQHSELLYMHDMELCCATDIADPLEIIYVDDEGGVHIKYLPNMIVRSCACG